MANDSPVPIPDPSEQPTDGRPPQPPRPVWWRRRTALISGAAVLTGVVIGVVILAIRPEGYDNTPEGAAQRLIDVLNDPDSSYRDLYANACASERREHNGPDRPLQGALHLVLDKVTRISDTKAVAYTHIKEIPENSLELPLVKEDGVWKDCGDAP